MDTREVTPVVKHLYSVLSKKFIEMNGFGELNIRREEAGLSQEDVDKAIEMMCDQLHSCVCGHSGQLSKITFLGQ